jgi:hypothetical protein
MCYQYVAYTRHYGCGDTTKELGAIDECKDKDKPGHKVEEKLAGSGSSTEKCGKSDCRRP